MMLNSTFMKILGKEVGKKKRRHDQEISNTDTAFVH